MDDSQYDVVKIKPNCDTIVIRNNEIYNSGQAFAGKPKNGEDNAESIGNVNGDNMVVQNNYIHDICSNAIYAKGGATETLIENNRTERALDADYLLLYLFDSQNKVGGKYMKKTVSLILVLLLTVSLLSACGGNSGGGGGGTPSSGGGASASNNGGSSNNGNNSSGSGSNSRGGSAAIPEPVTTELNKVVVDADDVKVTLTRCEYKDFYGTGMYYDFFFTIENNTDKEIRLGIERASVNGCMLVEVAHNGQKMRAQPGETNDEAHVTISDDDLEKRGISALRDFEFTPRLVGIDASLLLGGSDYLVSEPVSVQLPVDPGFTQTFDVDGVVLLDEQGVKITAIRVDYEFDLASTRDGVWMLIENNTGMDIDVSGSGTVNGEYISETSFYDGGQVTKDKVSFDYFSYYKPDLKDKGIDKIQEVTMTFSISGLTWDLFSGGTTLMDQKKASVSFDADGKAQ